MDYPHPLVKLNRRGEFDLGEVYDDKIGEWDKVAITWGYQDFPSPVNEADALNKIMINAAKKGLQFISDRDARAPGGMHPQAHLWDNGVSAADELREVMKVRAEGMKRFGENNILPGTPMALLEDALVPLYFYHRYQLEAATKVVGGMYYTYALRQDGQVVTRMLTKKEQQSALDAILEALDPAALLISDRIAALIPPRPAGYDFSRELFRKRTGLAFDRLAPAETVADMAFSFLVNSERLSRMVQYETGGGLGVQEMLSQLLTQTWKSGRRSGMEGLIQMQTEQVLLTYLLAASVDEQSNFAVRGILQKQVNELKIFVEEKLKSTTDAVYAGHLQLVLVRMKNPKDAKPTQQHREAPPGAPIGCE